MKKVAVLLVCFLLSMTLPSSAQQAGRLQSAETSFDYTLATLRESVDKLTRENQEQAGTNEKLRIRLRAMANELADLQRDEVKILGQLEVVNARYQKKMGNSQSPVAQASRLRLESSAIDEEFGKLTTAVAAKEKADQELRSAIDALGRDIRDLNAGEYSALSEESSRLIKERDRLRQQSNSAADSLQEIRQQWLDLQGVHELGAERTKALRRTRDDLAAILKKQKASNADLLQQVAAEEKTLTELAAPTRSYAATAAALEQELVSLKTRSQGLARELEKLKRADMERTQKTNEASEQERQQWEAKLADGEEKNRALRSELDKLRKEMIDLDKKKVSLERSL